MQFDISPIVLCILARGRVFVVFVLATGFFLQSMKAILQQAAKQTLQALIAAYPGHITIGTRTIKCAVFTERGMRWEGDGGQVQKQTLKAQIPCTQLPDSEIVNASNATKPVRITHVETGLVYQLDTENAPQKDPHGVYWEINGVQTTKT